MRGQSSRTFPSRCGAVAFGLTLTIGVIGVGATPSMALSCSVRDAQTHAIYSTLPSAVAAAASGDTLTLAGVCAGPVEVDRSLTIKGDSSSGAPTIDGSG